MSSFIKISDLILSKISENLKINDIWEISKVNSEEWEKLSEKIRSLTDHLKDHHKDFISRRGLLSMVGKRRNLLAYIKNKNEIRYNELIKALGLRR